MFKAKPEQMHLYTEKAEAAKIKVIRQRIRRTLEHERRDNEPSRWAELERKWREVEDDEISKLRLLFFQKRTGHPF